MGTFTGPAYKGCYALNHQYFSHSTSLNSRKESIFAIIIWQMKHIHHQIGIMKQFYTKFVSLVFESREHGANDLFTCICKLITIHQYISKCPNYAAVNKRDLAFSFVNVDFILTSFAISNIPFIRHSLRKTNMTDRQDAEYVNKTHFGEDCGALDVAPDVFALGSHILSIRSWKLLDQSS